MTNISDTDQRKIITFTVESPSLIELGNEPVPPEIIKNLIYTEWSSTLVPTPEVHVLNDTTYPEQGNLKLSDWVVIEMEPMRESQRGFTYELKDIEIPVIIQLHTMVDRQRLYNLMAEVRRIIYKNHIVTRPYQMIYWDSFEEDSDGLNRNWKGYCNIRLTSESVPVFKGVVEGMGSPNLPEDQR